MDITSVFLVDIFLCLTDNFAMAMYGLKLPDTSWQDKCPNCRGEMMDVIENGSGARLFSYFIWVFLLFSELLLTCSLCCYWPFQISLKLLVFEVTMLLITGWNLTLKDRKQILRCVTTDHHLYWGNIYRKLYISNIILQQNFTSHLVLCDLGELTQVRIAATFSFHITRLFSLS